VLKSFACDIMEMAYWETGRFDESINAARHLLAAHPNCIYAQLYLP
jgi:hypothetical protein